MPRPSLSSRRSIAAVLSVFLGIAVAAVIVGSPDGHALASTHPAGRLEPVPGRPSHAVPTAPALPGSPAAGVEPVQAAGPAGGHTAAAATATATATPTAPPVAPPAASKASWPLNDLRIVSYYPARWSWADMWLSWHPEVIDPDLERIAALHADVVRVIVPPRAFGYPGVSPTMTGELAAMVAMAGRHGLRVQLTLFDVGFSQWQDFAGSEHWAQAVVGPYAADPRIAFVEVRNEIDPAQAAQIAWARHMLGYVRSVAGGIPVTVSVCGCDNASDLLTLKQRLGSAQPDLYDFHFFADPGRAAAVFATAKAIAAPLPLVIGETGYSTWTDNATVVGIPWTTPAQEAYQEQYFRTVGLAARSAGLPPPAPWALTDLTCAGCSPSERSFGLYHVDGTAKPAAAAVAAMFGGSELDTGFNQGFESAAGPLPAGWRIWGWRYGKFARDTAVARSGSASASISGSSVVPGGSPPAFFASPAAPPVGGRAYTLTAYARGHQATGTTRVFINWYDGSSHLLGSSSSAALPSGDTGWTRLTVAARAPAGASFVTLVLASVQNTGTVWFDDIAFD